MAPRQAGQLAGAGNKCLTSARGTGEGEGAPANRGLCGRAGPGSENKTWDQY